MRSTRWLRTAVLWRRGRLAVRACMGDGERLRLYEDLGAPDTRAALCIRTAGHVDSCSSRLLARRKPLCSQSRSRVRRTPCDPKNCWAS